LFTAETLQGMLAEASLVATAQRGVRVVADYLPPQISLGAQYDRILGLECKLGKRPEFSSVARYTHCLARRASFVMEGEV
jgi:hypothetical protein